MYIDFFCHIGSTVIGTPDNFLHNSYPFNSRTQRFVYRQKVLTNCKRFRLFVDLDVKLL